MAVLKDAAMTFMFPKSPEIWKVLCPHCSVSELRFSINREALLATPVPDRPEKPKETDQPRHQQH
jgi:hypothetical protein